MLDQLDKTLQDYFNYTQFRPGQKEIIEKVMEEKDLLGVLPTGAGKSICYQLPSLLLPHITVVVSPLISLMIDQVRETKAFHIKQVAALHSMVSYVERKAILRQLDKYKILYLSPELIQNDIVIRELKKRKVSLFVIDEAHCISQWGYDFRPDYLRLNAVIESLNNPPILALSGTITQRIEQDILTELKRPNMMVFKQETERENIALLRQEISVGERKDEQLVDLLEAYHVPTIIYFSSRKQAEEIANMLTNKFVDRHIAYYHGGLDQVSRLKIQQQFLYDQLHIICATSAFGMGINKSNVRLIIHYHLPAQKESFIQEIGRAGRDGKQSVSILLYEAGDEFIPQQLIENELPTEAEVRQFFNYLYILYERNQSFPKMHDEIALTLGMNDTKIKFLHYQLESRHMIVSNQIKYNFENWKRALDEIVAYCLKRAETKLSDFQRMLQYVYTKKCLRIELYKEFGPVKEKETINCCSSCGYEENILKSEPINNSYVKQGTWQEELSFLFGIGEVNESK